MLGFGVKETTTTTGTGNLTVTSVSGFPTFNNVFGTSRSFVYSILDSAGAPIEHGIGHLSAATTLVRDKILATFVSATYDNLAPAAVSLAAGTKTVIGTVGPGQNFFASPNVDAGSSTNQPTRSLQSSHIITGAGLSSSAVVTAANQIYAMAHFLMAGIEATGMDARLGTGFAASNVRMGVYDLGLTGYPTNLLAETGNIASTASGADISGSFSGGNIFLPPGWYAVALAASAVVTIGGTTYGCTANPFGHASGHQLGITTRRDAAHTFGALPNPFPTASNISTQDSSGAMMMLGISAA